MPFNAELITDVIRVRTRLSISVILAAVLLGERLSALAIAGSGIVLAATILIMKYDSIQPPYHIMLP